MLPSRVMPILKRPARKCLRMLGWKRPPAPPVDDPCLTPFLCNVCGTTNLLPRSRLTREDGHCTRCQCYGRLRAMMFAVTTHFSPFQPVLAAMAPRKDIRGLGCSDWGYAALLAEKFDYVNTFYDHEPQMDLCQVDWTRWAPESFDFITCTDVLEHVEPPVDEVFNSMYRLLKPGGVAILTVPTSLEPATREHFPHLGDWRIESRGPTRVLVNRRPDGRIDQFDDLCFHGGEGMTLEFRLFSREGLIRSARAAGFHCGTILDSSVEAYAIPLSVDNFVLVAKKPNDYMAFDRKQFRWDGRRGNVYQTLEECQDEIVARTRTPGDIGSSYAPLYRQDELGYWLHIPRWLCEDFGARAERGEKLKFLDVGCAYGTLLLYATKMLGCEPYAVDFMRYLHPTLVEDYGIQYQINNVEREPLPWDAQFDAILMTEVLKHFNFKALPTLEKLRKHLAPGGRLYLSTPDASQWGQQTKYYSRYEDLPLPSADPGLAVIDDHVWQFDEAELRQLVATAGFRVARFDFSPGSGRRHFNLALEAG